MKITIEDVTPEQLSAIASVLTGTVKVTKENPVKNLKVVKSEPEETEDEDDDEPEEKSVKKKAAPAAKGKKKPEPEEDEDDDDAEEESDDDDDDDEPEVSRESIAEKVSALSKKGKKAKVQALLDDFGAATVAKLKKEDLIPFFTKLSKIK